MKSCVPVGSALPPRRDTVVRAAAKPQTSGFEGSINIQKAKDRIWELFEREQRPGDVRDSLASALNGNLHDQSLLFIAMMDSWPNLQKAINEVADEVAVSPWKIFPYVERGEEPTPESEELAKFVETACWGMKPQPVRREGGFKQTIKDLAISYYFGHGVDEIRWESIDGSWKPRATKLVPARYFGYPDREPEGDPEDRLMFEPEGGIWSRNMIDFPEYRFLIGINCGHPGHASVAAPLRALADYWMSAVYGLKWFMNFTQLYGIPWRHAEVEDPADDNAVASALARIGSQGYILTRPGTKINVLDSSKNGSELPQRELIELADKKCAVFILGQTLTSGTDESGSRALGEVHAKTRSSMVDAVSDYVGEILTHQLAPAIVAVNYGPDRKDIPEIWARDEEEKDEKAAAERVKILTDIGVPMAEAYVYEQLGVPIPAPEEKLFEKSKSDEKRDPDQDTKEDPEDDPLKKGKKKVSAAESKPLTVDELSGAVLEGLTGVTSEWLSPVKPFFQRLAALAMSNQVTDEDFLSALEQAQAKLPELFDLLNSETLQTAFENAISSAVLAGSVQRYEK